MLNRGLLLRSWLAVLRPVGVSLRAFFRDHRPRGTRYNSPRPKACYHVLAYLGTQQDRHSRCLHLGTTGSLAVAA